MIQFYINSRPVPRAIARHHIAEASPQYTLAEVAEMMGAAVHRDWLAVQRLAAVGVFVHITGA